MIKVPAFIFAILLIIVLIALYYFEDKEAQIAADDHPRSIENTSIESTKKTNREDPVVSDVTNAQPIEDEIGPYNLTVGEIFQINRWFRENGYTQQITDAGTLELDANIPTAIAPETSYQHYDMDILRSLAEADRFARIELGTRLKQQRKFDEAKTHLVESAIDGFGVAIMEVGGIHRKKGYDLLQSGSPEADQELVEAYAWDYVFQQRFFPELSGLVDQREFNIEEVRLVEIKQQATERGKVIYQELQDERRNRGLGEFDNSIPASAKRLF